MAANCCFCGASMLHPAKETCSAACRDMLALRRDLDAGLKPLVRSPTQEVEYNRRMTNAMPSTGWNDDPVADAMFSEGMPREVQSAYIESVAPGLLPARFAVALICALLIVLGLALYLGVHR